MKLGDRSRTLRNLCDQEFETTPKSEKHEHDYNLIPKLIQKSYPFFAYFCPGNSLDISLLSF